MSKTIALLISFLVFFAFLGIPQNLIGVESLSSRSIAITHLKKGEEYFFNQRFNEAIEEYKKAIEADPGFSEAHLGLGDAHFGMKRYDEAISSFNTAITLSPTWAEAYSFKADALTAQKKFTEAIVVYKQALEFKTNYPRVFKILGTLLNQMNFNEAASLIVITR